MDDCPGFLLLEKTPNVTGVLENGRIMDQNRYKVICQTFENKRRFVTLYDTRNKIPVFSAFKYRGTQGTMSERPRRWMMEPQLEPTATINMRNDKNQNQNQASNSDYFSKLQENDRGKARQHPTKQQGEYTIPSLVSILCYNHRMEKYVAAAYWGDNDPGELHSKTLEPNTLAELDKNSDIKCFLEHSVLFMKLAYKRNKVQVQVFLLLLLLLL
ncbi:hypothetical protein KUCAC02_031835 [Chaenocephalus aceratus]|nr:hypothetical protein KUCAC02_031835 [Chaenocephalus aceratus]